MTQPTDPPATGQKTRRFIPILRLVHPLPELPAAPPRRRKGLRGPPVFTPDEEQLLRASIRVARTSKGSWRALGAAMHVNPDTLRSLVHGKGKRISAEIAVRLSKAVNVPLDVLLTPGPRLVEPRSGPEGAG